MLNATFYGLNDEQEKFFESIPHGSGIDNRWIITKMKGYWHCFNSFYCMNDCGMYVGYADFSVIIPFKNPEEFRLHFHGEQSQQLNQKNCLRECIEQTMYHWIAERAGIKKEQVEKELH